MAFYIELPADEYGNTAYGDGVIEGEIVGEGRESVMMFKAPDKYVKNWPNGALCHHYGGWLEVDGPVRDLSFEERKAVLAKYGKSWRK